ncbi:MAG: hypothetical protein ACRDT6_17220 [Micromonosporaceae bacterium]
MGLRDLSCVVVQQLGFKSCIRVAHSLLPDQVSTALDQQIRKGPGSGT